MKRSQKHAKKSRGYLRALARADWAYHQIAKFGAWRVIYRGPTSFGPDTSSLRRDPAIATHEVSFRGSEATAFVRDLANAIAFAEMVQKHGPPTKAELRR